MFFGPCYEHRERIVFDCEYNVREALRKIIWDMETHMWSDNPCNIKGVIEITKNKVDPDFIREEMKKWEKYVHDMEYTGDKIILNIYHCPK